MNNYTLKKCPICGSDAELIRGCSGYRTNPTTIIDEWKVRCTNQECGVYVCAESNIYQSEDGEIHIDANGAELAVDKWNTRAGENE